MGKEHILSILIECKKPVSKHYIWEKYPYSWASFARCLRRLCKDGLIIKFYNYFDNQKIYYVMNEDKQ